MSMLDKFLTPADVERMSEGYDFNPEDPYFHFDHEFDEVTGAEMLESCDPSTIEWFNHGMPSDLQMVLYTDLTPEEQAEYAPKSA